jgi:hypothetical protein
MLRRLTLCVGCEQPFSRRKPVVHVCHFQRRGFPLDETNEDSTWATPCGVSYHADCICVEEPFRTRLGNQKGLICPSFPNRPHYVCELCQTRAILRREIQARSNDIELLMMERKRTIDTMSWWQKSTMAKYGPYLNFLHRFGNWYQVPMLEPVRLDCPPRSEAIPLMWSQLLYLLCEYDGHRVLFAEPTICVCGSHPPGQQAAGDL